VWVIRSFGVEKSMSAIAVLEPDSVALHPGCSLRSCHFLRVSKLAGGLLSNTGARGSLRKHQGLLLVLGFKSLGLSEVVSFTTVRNFRSRAVMQRLGMYEIPETFEHPHVPMGSPLRLY